MTSEWGGWRQCPHGYHHPPFTHSCDGCWCEGESDRRLYGWQHDTSPKFLNMRGADD